MNVRRAERVEESEAQQVVRDLGAATSELDRAARERNPRDADERLATALSRLNAALKNAKAFEQVAQAIESNPSRDAEFVRAREDLLKQGLRRLESNIWHHINSVKRLRQNLLSINPTTGASFLESLPGYIEEIGKMVGNDWAVAARALTMVKAVEQQTKTVQRVAPVKAGRRWAFWPF